jgi:RimJ/RimL family protein N-acetyltransferase
MAAMERGTVLWAGYRWQTLVESDVAALALELDHPPITRWLCSRGPTEVFPNLRSRSAGDALGESLHVIPHLGGRPLGFAALRPYLGIPGRLQTSIYLSPRAWGTGLNRRCASLLWRIGHAMLRHRVLVASIDADNGRSLAARRKLAQGEPNLVFEPWYPRLAYLFELRGPPRDAHPIGASTERRFARLTRTLPTSRLRAGELLVAGRPQAEAANERIHVVAKVDVPR